MGTTVHHFHSNTHVSGYLPESDVSTHDTASEAWAYLAEEIERAWDADYEAAGDDIDLRMLADDRFLQAHTEAGLSSTAGWIATHERSARRLPLIFEVIECDGCDYAEDDEGYYEDTTTTTVSLIKTYAPVSLIKTYAPRFDMIEVTACVCCALVAANGECGCEEHDREPLSLLVPGEVLTIDGEPWFSWRPCLCCGSSLGGDRYDGTILVAVTA